MTWKGPARTSVTMRTELWSPESHASALNRGLSVVSSVGIGERRGRDFQEQNLSSSNHFKGCRAKSFLCNATNISRAKITVTFNSGWSGITTPFPGSPLSFSTSILRAFKEQQRLKDYSQGLDFWHHLSYCRGATSLYSDDSLTLS